MKDLPQELLDEIMGYIRSSDKQFLRNCSLVAKLWTAPSQRRLFKFINLSNVVWCPLSEHVPPKHVELFRHVRSASANGSELKTEVSSEILNHTPHHGPLFPRLRRLKLSAWDFPSLSQIGIALTSQHSLEYLTLADCHTSISELVKLINHFPNLIYLKLDCLRRTEKDDGPIPLLSNRIPKLSVRETSSTHGDPRLTEQLLGPNSQFEEVTISVRAFFAPLFAQRVIESIKVTVKCLNMHVELECLHDPLTLANCDQLRTLKMYSLEKKEPELISTITSMGIQKIIFLQHRSFQGYDLTSVRRDYWVQLDDSLCRLVGRPGYELRLEVEFLCRTQEWAGGPHLEKCLPMFHMKGRVRVVDKWLGTVAYCSDGTG